jgi:hypothetical protein
VGQHRAADTAEKKVVMKPKPKPPRCRGKTKAGKRCTKRVVEGTHRCGLHPAGKKMGRPKIEDTWVSHKGEPRFFEMLQSLLSFGANEAEIAAHFECSIETICNACKRKYGTTFLEQLEQKKPVVKLSIRRALLDEAVNRRNTAALIFAAKNLLGWSDKQHLEHTGKNGAPLIPLIAEIEYVDPGPEEG